MSNVRKLHKHYQYHVQFHAQHVFSKYVYEGNLRAKRIENSGTFFLDTFGGLRAPR